MGSRYTIDESSSKMIDEMDRDVVDETKRFGKKGYFGKETFTGDLSGGEDGIDNSHLCEEGHSHDRNDRAASAYDKPVNDLPLFSQRNTSASMVHARPVKEVSVYSKRNETAGSSAKNEPKPKNGMIAGVFILVAVFLVIADMTPVAAFFIFIAMFLLQAMKDDGKNILRNSVVLTAVITALLVVAKNTLLGE